MVIAPTNVGSRAIRGVPHCPPREDQLMKTIIVAFCLLCATAAVGQTARFLSNNPQHASEHAMATETSLFGATSAYTYAQGERPLWEFGSSDKHEVPLGDVAR